MKSLPANPARILLAALALVLELAHLAWEHFHGGVVAHHLLNRADMPAISNWWGVVLVPALAWFVVGRVQRRMSGQGIDTQRRIRTAVIAGFLCALIYGAALALAFTLKLEAVSYIFFGLLVAALILPAYRAECLLGFVLGMTVTFGAVLPTVIGLLIVAISRVAHLLFGFVWRFARNARPARPQ